MLIASRDRRLESVFRNLSVPVTEGISFPDRFPSLDRLQLWKSHAPQIKSLPPKIFLYNRTKILKYKRAVLLIRYLFNLDKEKKKKLLIPIMHLYLQVAEHSEPYFPCDSAS